MYCTVMSINDAFKIEGESILKGYEGWVDCKGLAHGITLPMTVDKSSNSRTSGRPDLADVEVMLSLDKTYPKFIEACGGGKKLGKIKISTCRVINDKLNPICEYELGGVFISKVKIVGGTEAELRGAGGPDDHHPMVLVGLNYASIAVKYHEYDNDGQKKGEVASKELNAALAF